MIRSIFAYDFIQNSLFRSCNGICRAIVERVASSASVAVAQIGNYFGGSTNVFYSDSLDRNVTTKAAITIQNTWRAFARRKLKNTDPTLARSVADLVVLRERNALKYLSYYLFAKDSSFVCTFSNNARILMRLFQDPDAYLSDIGLVILKTYEEHIRHKKWMIENSSEEGKRWVTERESAPRYHHWGDDPNRIVRISHGGGFNYIKEFLAGRSKGYWLDNGGTGIQVSPVDMGRDDFYATRGAPKHFDVPAVLQAEIEARYLDNAPNTYEAGLRPEYVKHLRNVSLIKLDLPSEAICGSFPASIDWEKAEKEYTKSQVLRLKSVVDRLRI